MKRLPPTFLLAFLASGPAFPGVAGTDPAIETVRPGVRIELVAENPEIVTPTGVDVDEEGKIWVVSCHTHMPPEDYAGPEKDEILVFDREGNRSVFHDDTHHTMDLEFGPDGWVYLAERDRILRIRDTDGDGRAEAEETLAELSTEADYPHNGLSGLGWHPDGDLVFGLGENYAQGWVLRDRSGAEFSGIGEGGVFRCRPDGTGLRRVARGMWNPFGLCVRRDGAIFVSDNDPGERPPCRLLHIVEGGDYGYQRLYGGGAHHPFVCWNGELRGALPMVNPTGEAPCGVVPFRGGLLVPSWGDHRVDFLPLRRKGASFEAERFPLVEGSRYFRPTCIAEAPSPAEDGTRTWVLTDWVDGRYPVHGLGRLWRLEIDPAAAKEWAGPSELEAPGEMARLAEQLRNGKGNRTRDELLRLARHEDPYVARAALLRLADGVAEWSPGDLRELSDADRASAVLALKLGGAEAGEWIPRLLEDPAADVVFETLRWIADRQLADFRPAVEDLLARSDLSFEVFEAGMAAWNTLSGMPDEGVRNPEKLLARVRDEDSPPRLRAFALRLLPQPLRRERKSDPAARVRYPEGLTVELLRDLLAARDPALSREAVRVLAGSPGTGAPALAEVARDPKRPAGLRAEAIAGLAPVAGDHEDDLLALAGSEAAPVREEALRALRGHSLAGAPRERIEGIAKRFPRRDFPRTAALAQALLRPETLVQGRPAMDDLAAWMDRLDGLGGQPDPAAGERIFHHPSLALCSRCHRHSGRGNVVGPDLSVIQDRGDRGWLLRAILQPARDVAPEYLPRTVTLKDGTSATGIRLRSWTREQLRDANGYTVTFDKDEVASIRELETSLMPPGLVYTLTDHELRDLLAFLRPADRGATP